MALSEEQIPFTLEVDKMVLNLALLNSKVVLPYTFPSGLCYIYDKRLRKLLILNSWQEVLDMVLSFFLLSSNSPASLLFIAYEVFFLFFFSCIVGKDTPGNPLG